MRVTMVKKVLTSGSACRKCEEATERLERMGLWEQIDRVLTIEEDGVGGEGIAMAQRLGIERAPFFVVEQDDGTETVYQSVMLLIRKVLQAAESTSRSTAVDLSAANESLGNAEPLEIVRWALKQYSDKCAIAFSGAEDVVLIHMAAQTGLPFSVFVLDTGRLHPETLRFVEDIRNQYNTTIEIFSPERQAVEDLVAQKGLFSFYEDGHQECCGVRKVEPLKRALSTRQAWITGQRADQSPETRGDLPVIQADPAFTGSQDPLVKINPLVRWSSEQVWSYIRNHQIPSNPLHDQGFRSIGCAPCTRAVGPDQHEREGRWWWEDALSKECGLHVNKESD